MKRVWVKSSHHHEGDDEVNAAFWVSYADLMAGIFLVFLLMLVLALHQHAKAQKIIRDEMTRNLDEQKRTLEDLHRMAQEIQNQKMVIEKGKDKVSRFAEEQKMRTQRISALESEVTQLKSKLADSETKVTSGEKSLTETQVAVQTKDGEISKLRDELAKIGKAFEAELAVIKKKAEEITTLFGVRKDIVDRLSQGFAAGDESLKTSVDPGSGAIKLEGAILFDEASSEIKPEAKEKLEQFMRKYLQVLFTDPTTLKYLSQIVIEGHTNDNGTYANNLRLSQERSRAVMEYLQGIDTPYKDLLEKYVVASGRSYSEPVMTADSKVDKVKSRRIEFKFRLKDEEAVRSMGEVLKTGP